MTIRWPTHNKRFLVALTVSLTFHLLLLFFKFPTPHDVLESNPSRVPSQLDVRLSPPDRAAPPHTLPPPSPSTAKAQHKKTQIQAVPMITEADKTWTATEKNEMNHFLNELSAQSKPSSGTELARRALAMAKTLGREDEKNDEMAEITQRLRAANIEPLSLELYFEALFRKLNRSAAMVKNDAHDTGKQIAEVRVTLNPNGSVKSFTILNSADQQAEIAYIKSVVDRAAPFPMFPADIRSATDKLILQICIHPERFGGGNGAQFTRMSRGQSCRGGG